MVTGTVAFFSSTGGLGTHTIRTLFFPVRVHGMLGGIRMFSRMLPASQQGRKGHDGHTDHTSGPRDHSLGKPNPENGSPLGPNRSKTGRRREGRGRRARLPRCRCQRGGPQTGPRGSTAETLPPARTPAHRHSGQAFGQGPVLTAEGGRAGSTRSLHEVLPTKAGRSAKQLSGAHRLRALRRRWHHPRSSPQERKSRREVSATQPGGA